MKTKHIVRKSFPLAAAIAAVLATQVSAADDTDLFWGKHVKPVPAASSGRVQEQILASRRRQGDRLMWREQLARTKATFAQPAQQGNAPSRHDSTEHLIWAVQCQQAYRPALATETVDSTEIALTR